MALAFRIIKTAVITAAASALVLGGTPGWAHANPTPPAGATCKPFEYYYPDVSGICASTPIGGYNYFRVRATCQTGVYRYGPWTYLSGTYYWYSTASCSGQGGAISATNQFKY